MGFNAPRVIGGGQIIQPQQVDAMGDIQDAVFQAADMKQKQKEYDRDFYENAIDQDLKRKWLENDHRNRAYEAWKVAIPQDEDGRDIPFDEYYQQRYPNIGTKFSIDNFNAQYQSYLEAVNNPQGLGAFNPADGMWYPGKGFIQRWKDRRASEKETEVDNLKDPATDLFGVSEEVNLNYIPGQQRGSYVPGNRTGDKNPAMLEDGEYVLNRNAVKALGKGWLDYVNNEQYPRFQTGGFIKPEATGGTGTVVGPMQVNAFGNAMDMMTKMVGMGSGGDTNVDAGPGSMNLATAEGDPIYESMIDDIYDWDFGATYAQKGGYIPGYQEGGYKRRVEDPYTYLDMIYPSQRARYEEDQRKAYEDDVVRNMARDLREKRDVVASHEALDREWDNRYSQYGAWNPKSWITGFAEGVVHPVMDRLGSATGLWPSYTDIKAQQYREADRWEETPFPKSIDMTPEDMIWREETYYPNNPIGDMGTSNISNKILKERLKQLRGLE